MKTRCVRSPRSQVCVRCTRLGFSCHYSPPGRTGRPAGSKQKNATNRNKPSSRSSYEKSNWCNTVVPLPSCTGPPTVNPIIPGQTSPALTAQDAFHLQLPVNFSELELFGSESSFSDGANSMVFMDDLFQDVMSSSMTNSASKLSVTPPSTVSQEPLEHIFFDSAPSSSHNSVASMEVAEYVLLDAQGQLLNLVRALSSCSSFPQDVEEIYRITDTFVKVVDDIAAGLDASSSSAGSSSVTHMLLSSCYMSLIQAYECLVGLLRRELGPPPPKVDRLEQQQHLGIPPTGTQIAGPLPSTTANNVPFISSVGNVRLEMPHRAVAEINLQLVGQAVQHLQASISRCAAKVRPGLGMEKGRSVARSSSICAFTKMAMVELEQRESTLFSGLQMPTLQ
ncbi:hypothetical protein ISF_09149 [Cordyceps fumosorosea ARSEF 2679]|uniref:Zn(2)-C6 fungal-type domain-containing protein n=1 Tax=Cordyceps fumosorosea (strain ARSEF 2679) TaxID=1081104 RepID=A0A167LE66_CORFA|nr:hypothetical protein ISF_09149 [Cordyceps fumosorosea ARSEF 2679]OAA52981.1 hypothetical protein ISF_09149 [Cordyceps fumosorosea ARSEF 2679]